MGKHVTYLPPLIADGFHREDYAAREAARNEVAWLRATKPPAVGQHVKIQITFSDALPTRIEGESSTWSLMGGEVVEVRPDGRLRALISATSDLTPAKFDDGEWEALLFHDPQWENPWQLQALAQV